VSGATTAWATAFAQLATSGSQFRSYSIECYVLGAGRGTHGRTDPPILNGSGVIST
jgi:hypothetical protein